MLNTTTDIHNMAVIPIPQETITIKRKNNLKPAVKKMDTRCVMATSSSCNGNSNSYPREELTTLNMNDMCTDNLAHSAKAAKDNINTAVLSPILSWGDAKLPLLIGSWVE